ncbi:hypothetical protein [Streptomyces sp. NPDC058394]|uniref:hypothetical protein n=1 Tax=unclassified Streptomyces TaxID=2593676 RepID=UPI0036621483
MSQPVVDWPATEAALGTSLPNDYKGIVDLFGSGGFDEYLDLLVPGVLGMDLVAWSKGDAVQAAELWRPHAVYPARHGLLRWGASEQEIDFVRQTGRPTLTTGRCSCSTTSVIGSNSTAVLASSFCACSRT